MDFYGIAASISGNGMVIGSSGDGASTGAAYFPSMSWIADLVEVCPVSPEVPFSVDAFPLRVSAAGSWNASSDSPWVTIDTASGTGNGEVGLTIAANSTTSPRAAKVTVEGAEHLITQAGAPVGTSAGPRISAPGKLKAGNKGKIKVSVASQLGINLTAKASGGAKSKVKGGNPYKVIVSKLKGKVTPVKLTATDSLGRTSRKTVKLKKR